MTRLDQIRRRLEAATPGPWVYGNSHVLQVVQGDYIESERPYNPITGSMKGILRREDGELIAHAPQDLRDLLELAEAIRPVLSFLDAYPKEVGPLHDEEFLAFLRRRDDLTELLSRLDAPEVEES